MVNTIEEAIEDIKAGRMVILVDDEDRENEGDLTMAAELVTPEDIKQIAPDVLRHRIITTYEAEAQEVDSAAIVQRILDHVEVP